MVTLVLSLVGCGQQKDSGARVSAPSNPTQGTVTEQQLKGPEFAKVDQPATKKNWLDVVKLLEEFRIAPPPGPTKP